MPTRQRPVDRGTDRARRILADLGRELRTARVGHGLSLAAVARAARMSISKVSRIERGLSPRVTVIDLARIHAVVGLELWARSFPGGSPIRDAGQVKVLRRLREHLHPALRWSLEVAFPASGDQRAWDAVVTGPTGWRFGIEVETAPQDVQALARRLALKARDGGVDGVLLVLPRSKQARAFLSEARHVLGPDFPVFGLDVLRALEAGSRPQGSSVVVI